MYVCVCMYVCMYVRMYVSYVCECVCMHASMHACMNQVTVYTYTRIDSQKTGTNLHTYIFSCIHVRTSPGSTQGDGCTRSVSESQYQNTWKVSQSLRRLACGPFHRGEQTSPRRR
jgi:hypothetical protein